MTINANISNVDALSRLALAGGAREVGDVRGGVGIQDANLTLSYVDANGNTKTVSVSVPDIDDAGHVATADELSAVSNVLSDAVEGMNAGIESLSDAGAGTGVQKTLFDIYALMKLMIEISQQQRNVARDERYADLNLAVASIKDQAAIQRQAALTSMIITCVTTAVSVGCMLAGAAKSLKASHSQDLMLREGGMNQLRGEMSSVSAGLKSPEAAETNLQKVQTDLGLTDEQIVRFGDELGIGDPESPVGKPGAELGKLQEQLGSAKTKLAENTERIVDLEKEKATWQGSVDELEGKIADIDSQKRELAGRGGATEADTARIANLDKERAVLADARDYKQGKIGRIDAEIGELRAENANLTASVESLERDIPDVSGTYCRELENRLTGLRGELDEARTGLSAERTKDNPSKEAIADAQKRVDALNRKIQWGRAFVSGEESRTGQTGMLSDNMKQLQVDLKTTEQGIADQAVYQKYQSEAGAWNMISQVANQLGGGLNSVTQQMSAYMNASATEAQAEQKTAEAAHDESSDLFNSAKELFTSVLQLMQAVLQAETQSIHQIVA